MSSTRRWHAIFCGAVATLVWMSYPAIGHANALFVDDFETGGTGDWSQEEAAPGVEGAAAVKFFPALENGVPGHYGVSLYSAPTASAVPELLVGSVGGILGYVYRYAILGFQAELSEFQAAQLSRHPLVKRVIQERYLEDSISYVYPHCYTDLDNETDPNTDPFPPLPAENGPPVEQEMVCSDPAPSGNCYGNWGLDRLDQDVDLIPNGPPRDESYRYRQDARSVTVFTIDTGVAKDNREFYDEGTLFSRVQQGVDTRCVPFPCGFGNVPCVGTWSGQGHGTHVAAILGGRTFGVAKDVNIVPIKALCTTTPPGQYSTEQWKLAFEYVLFAHGDTSPTAVVNLSALNQNVPCVFNPIPACDEYSQLREAVISVARRDNLLLVQSSGNKQFSTDSLDACSRSFGDELRYSDIVVPPAVISDRDAIARIIIAAGSDENDGRLNIPSGEPTTPIQSTIGTCVDIFAPAAHVASAFFPVNAGMDDPDEAVCQLSGTSMAAPHVSGIAALFLQDDPYLTSEELKTLILARGIQGYLETNSADPNYIGAGSPDLLLHWDPIVLEDGFETGNFVAWSSYSP
ncbi:MAG: S8 family serine peptidase [Thermoanaerobaculia bacterium]